MAEFTVTPADYLPGGRLFNNPNIVTIPPQGVEPVIDKATGVSYVPGTRAVEVIQTGKGYENLPQEVKAVLGGGGGGYNPFATAQGYYFDEKTGQFIVQTAPGSFSFLGASYTKSPTGQIVPKSTLSSASPSGSATTAATTPQGTAVDPNKIARQSAYDFLFEQFSQYGLGALVQDIRGLIESDVSPSEFTIRLRGTDAYKRRFAANQQRIAKGLRALSEAEYIGLEDQYQNIMRNYGLPASYYARGEMGRQEGFEKFIGGDVSAAELEDRIQTAQNRVINAAPEVSRALRQFYPGITNGDILAYALDPEKALTDIRRKVTAAEIGGAATMAGLATGATRAEELARYGVTGETARQGFQTIAGVLPRGSQLAEIYKQSPYTQTTAEQEVFGLAGAAEAGRQRRKLTELEQAAFSGQAGAAGGALARDRAGAF